MTPSPSMKGKKAIYDEQMGVCLDRYLVVEDECSSLDSVSMPTSSAARLMTTTSNKTSHFHRRSIEDSRKQVPIGLVGSQKKLDKLEMRPPPSSVKSVQSSKFEAKSCSSANKPSVQTTIEASSVGVQVTGDMTIETSGEREPGESNMSTASLDDTEKQRNSEVVNTQPQVSEGVGDDSKRAGSSEMKADDQRRNEVELPEQAVDLRPPSLPPSPSTVSELPASENKSQPAESIECTVDPTVQQLSSTPTTSEMEKVTMAAHVVGNHDLARTTTSSSFTMSKLPELTKPAPDFCGQAVVDGQFKEIKLSDYKGKYLVLFFYPLDFTFVCPTEIISFSDKAEDFRKINCEVVACSTDSHFSHFAWINTPRKQGGLGTMNIPLLADKTGQIAKDYGCFKEDEGIAFRGLYIIDDKGRLRQITINDLPVGRSVDETLRLVQAFQFTDKHGEVCPANWKPGDKTMKPDTNASKEYFEQTH